MKLLLIAAFSLLGLNNLSFAQESETSLFAQCLFTIEDQSELNRIQSSIREIPYVTIVRLDWHTQRAFILVNGLETLSKEELISWFEEYGDTLSCFQFGIHGVDEIATYPFNNCED